MFTIILPAAPLTSLVKSGSRKSVARSRDENTHEVAPQWPIARLSGEEKVHTCVILHCVNFATIQQVPTLTHKQKRRACCARFDLCVCEPEIGLKCEKG